MWGLGCDGGKTALLQMPQLKADSFSWRKPNLGSYLALEHHWLQPHLGWICPIYSFDFASSTNPSQRVTQFFHQATKAFRRSWLTGTLQRLFQAANDKISSTACVQSTILQGPRDIYKEGFIKKVTSNKMYLLCWASYCQPLDKEIFHDGNYVFRYLFLHFYFKI